MKFVCDDCGAAGENDNPLFLPEGWGSAFSIMKGHFVSLCAECFGEDA